MAFRRSSMSPVRWSLPYRTTPRMLASAAEARLALTGPGPRWTPRAGAHQGASGTVAGTPAPFPWEGTAANPAHSGRSTRVRRLKGTGGGCAPEAEGVSLSSVLEQAGFRGIRCVRQAAGIRTRQEPPGQYLDQRASLPQVYGNYKRQHCNDQSVMVN